MATARQRLQQLTIGQEEAQERSIRARQASIPEPRGGGILTRPIRPSQAAELDPSIATPFLDFKEFFLNQLGISTERQRLAQAEIRIAEDEANKGMLEATREQLAIIASRGLGGINVDRFKSVQAQLQSAAKLLDNPIPEMSQFGREQIQSIANSLDLIVEDQDEFIDNQRTIFNDRLKTIQDNANTDTTLFEPLRLTLARAAKEQGANANADRALKDQFAQYAGITQFGQAAQQATAFGIPVASFDPTEQFTIGTLVARAESIRQGRQLTFADQLGREMQSMKESGLRAADKNGVLTAEEIVVPKLAPLIQESRFNIPSKVTPGLPSEQTINQSVQNISDIFGGLANRAGSALVNRIFGEGDIPEPDANIPPGMMKAGDRSFVEKMMNPMTPGKLIPRRERETN